MIPALHSIQSTYTRLGYKWHPLLNLTGVRSTLNSSNVFNDSLTAAWLQPEVPARIGTLAMQQWLNQWFYVGANGLKLTEDGKAGKNYEHALSNAHLLGNTWRLKSWTITTDPGLKYLQSPLNPDGCAVLKPGQYPGMWMLGFHQGKPDHPALVQHGGECTVYLDNDRDGVPEETLRTKTGYFGINGHRASLKEILRQIGGWSAGCQVFPNSADHAELLRICRSFAPQLPKYTYTLLREKEIR